MHRVAIAKCARYIGKFGHVALLRIQAHRVPRLPRPQQAKAVQSDFCAIIGTG